MTFIREHSRDFIERVCIRRILAEAHQKDGIFLSNAKVHSFLKRRFLRRHEIVIANDIVDFHFELHVSYARAGPLNTSS